VIDPSLAQEARQLLSVAIGVMIEDVQDLAVRVHVDGEADRDGILLQTGQDVVALAAAMGVLSRRAAVAEAADAG
jgi:methionine synthase II (cobalamin-independent)